MPTEGTLCEIIDARNSRLLLKLAVKGISKGKWNGPGGKMEAGETPEQCCVREVEEETGLKVSNLFYHGKISFHNNGREEVDWAVHLFSTRDFKGVPNHSEEGEVRWFPIRELPFDRMWEDDRYWMEHVLQRMEFDADFWFDEGNRKIIKKEIRFK